MFSLPFLSLLAAVAHAAPVAGPVTPLQLQPGLHQHSVIFQHPLPPGLSLDSIMAELPAIRPDHICHRLETTGLEGFVAHLDDATVDAIKRMPGVHLVGRGGSVHHADLPSTHWDRGVLVDGGVPWGLESISGANAPSQGSPGQMGHNFAHDPNVGGQYNENIYGGGVDVYVIDSGVTVAHRVFQATSNQVKTDRTVTFPYAFNGDLNDRGFHGTHVAGTVAGFRVGVAPFANIISVKAIDGTAEASGTSGDLIKAIEHAISLHNNRLANSLYPNPTFRGSVINLSMASSLALPEVDHALRAATAAGIHVVVAAGNSAGDACLTSPARNGGAGGPVITVGSVSNMSTISSFSSTGQCVDVYAPGENIVSAVVDGGTDLTKISTMSGTSMASPHVAGIVAVLCRKQPVLARRPAAMKQCVACLARQNVIGGNTLNNGPKLLAKTGDADDIARCPVCMTG